MKILAVSSPGGHKVQLELALVKLGKHEVVFSVASPQPSSFTQLKDFSLWSFWYLPINLLKSLVLVLSVRPDIIISTGAAPGFCVVFIGKLCSCHTIWIDSLANTERISLSGRLSALFCHQHLTQWAHLSSRNTHYRGSVL